MLTSNSAMGTPFKGLYRLTLKSLGLVEGNATTLPFALSEPREQSPLSVGSSSIYDNKVILYKHNHNKDINEKWLKVTQKMLQSRTSWDEFGGTLDDKNIYIIIHDMKKVN